MLLGAHVCLIWKNTAFLSQLWFYVPFSGVSTQLEVSSKTFKKVLKGKKKYIYLVYFSLKHRSVHHFWRKKGYCKSGKQVKRRNSAP